MIQSIPRVVCVLIAMLWLHTGLYANETNSASENAATTSEETSAPKRFAVSLEVGGGTLVGLNGEYRTGLTVFGRPIGFGVGTAFNYLGDLTFEQDFGEDTFSSFLFSGSVFGIYHIVDQSHIIIDARLKAGFTYVRLEYIGTHVFEGAGDILLGYRNFYAFISVVTSLYDSGDVSVDPPYLGAGYRFRF